MPATDGRAYAGAVFNISRVFKAPRDLVWKAWSDPALWAQWFGPKGVTTTILSFDLRPGGFTLARMDSPDGQSMWGKFVYREIVERSRLVWIHSFADAQGNVVRAPFSETWPLALLATVTLTDEAGGTRITVTWWPLDASEAERKTFEDHLDSMKMGWTGSFDQFEALLASGQV